MRRSESKEDIKTESSNGRLFSAQNVAGRFRSEEAVKAELFDIHFLVPIALNQEVRRTIMMPTGSYNIFFWSCYLRSFALAAERDKGEPTLASAKGMDLLY